MFARHPLSGRGSCVYNVAKREGVQGTHRAHRLYSFVSIALNGMQSCFVLRYCELAKVLSAVEMSPARTRRFP